MVGNRRECFLSLSRLLVLCEFVFFSFYFCIVHVYEQRSVRETWTAIEIHKQRISIISSEIEIYILISFLIQVECEDDQIGKERSI